MNFKEITNIGQLYQGNKVAITTNSLDTEEKGNVSIIFGKVSYMITNSKAQITGASISFNDELLKNMIVTDDVLKLQKIYKVSEKNMAYFDIKSKRKLAKAEKMNKKYRAMLVKRFGVTEEEIDRNFDNKPKQKVFNFATYKTLTDKIPYVNEDGLIKDAHAIVKFSANNKNEIKCELSVYENQYKDNFMFTVEAIAKCHEEDNFSLKAGEVISYNKAFAKAVCKLH